MKKIIFCTIFIFNLLTSTLCTAETNQKTEHLYQASLKSQNKVIQNEISALEHEATVWEELSVYTLIVCVYGLYWLKQKP